MQDIPPATAGAPTGLRDALAQERAILEQVVGQSPVATLVVWGPDYRVRLINQRWLELFPADQPVVEGTVAAALPSLAAVLKPFLDRVARTGKPCRAGELPLRAPTGAGLDGFRFFTFTANPIGPRGSVDGIVVVGIEATDEVRRRRNLEQQLEAEQSIADMLQRSLLPRRFPQVPGLAFASRYIPGATNAGVGGDWYDVIPLAGDRVGLVIGDIAGHGLASASMMGQLRHALRAYATEGHGPAAVMQRLDRLLEPQAQIATVCYGELDVAARRLVFVSAGHPPILAAAGGRTDYLTGSRNTPLGTGLAGAYEETVVALEPSFTLIFYTDGLVERRSAPIEDGLARLRGIVAHGAGDVESLCEEIVNTTQGGGRSMDDVALLVVRDLPLARNHLRLTLPAAPDALDRVRSTMRLWLRDAGAAPEEAYELVTAIGEACMNVVVHAYGLTPGLVDLEAVCRRGDVTITVRDHGRWRPPSASRGGYGLSIMKAMTDDMARRSGEAGTEIVLRRRLRRTNPR